MATDFGLKQGTTTAVQTSGASASLANGTAVACATANVANQTNLDDFATFELTGGFGSSPTLPAALEVYLVPANDGTNFADVNTTSGSSYLSPSQFAGLIPVALSQTASQRMTTSARVPLGPRLYKVYLLNRTGQTLSSGWALNVYGGRYQSV